VKAALIVFAACANNTFRSPAFQTITAPEPTIVTMVVKCLSYKHDHADVVADALEAELRKGGELAVLDGASRVGVCDEIGNDATLSTMGTDWEAGTRVVGPIVQTLAKHYGAKSVLLPFVHSVDRCAASAKPDCKESSVDVALLLYDANGLPLWRSIESLSAKRTSRAELSEEMHGIVQETPAVRIARLKAD